MRFDFCQLRKNLILLCIFLFTLLCSTTLLSLLSPAWSTPAVAHSEAMASHSTMAQIPNLTRDMQDLSISGPISGMVGAAYEYTITVAPVTATTPIDYYVQATGQSLQTLMESQSHAVVASYSWDTPGTKTISVTVENALSTLTGTLDVEIFGPTIPMSSIEVEGPTTGQVEQSYQFTITVLPTDATGPFDFTVDATEQDQQTLLDSENSAIVATYSWDNLGVKTINVLIKTDAGNVSTTFDITIAAAPPHLYMPKLDK